MYKQNTRNKWTIGFILSFSKKVKLGITKNYTGITLNAMVPKIYNAVLLKRIQLDNELILRKNQHGFRRNRSLTAEFLIIHRIIKGLRAKMLELILDFSKTFDSMEGGKEEQILLA